MGVGPLIDEIQDDLDASHALVGLLGTIPVLCMGLFAPVAAYLSARLGTRRAMTIGLALIGTFGVLRALAPSAALVVLLTWGVGIGMGLGNALAPLAVRETVPERPATGTGVYTTGIQIGSTVAAAIVVPLAGLLGGWRGSLIALSAVACVIAVAWAGARAGWRGARPPPGRLFPRLPWRSRTAWLLVAIFASMGSAYYGLNAWLPDAYGERGWSDSSAGLLLACDEPDRDPVLVRRPVAVRPSRGQAAVARRGDVVLRRGRDRSRGASPARHMSGRSSPASRRAARSRS